MAAIADRITDFTRIALGAECLPTTTLIDTDQRLDFTIQLRPRLDNHTLGTRRPMTLSITEEDGLYNVAATYPEHGHEVTHEAFWGIHPLDLDQALHSLSYSRS